MAGDPTEVESGGRSWVYVAGAGRSGTTLLGMALARETGAFNCGELIHLWPRLAAGALCQCGSSVARCEVWADVAAGVRRQIGSPSVAELAGRMVGLRTPPLDVRLPRPTGAEVELRELTERVIEEVTGATALIDTSKSYYELATATYRDRPLTVVHVVRDPRAVAYSNLRTKADPAQGGSVHLAPRPVWKSALKWSVSNVRTERVVRRRLARPGVHASIRVRYEVMTLRPDETLASVVDAVATPSGGPSALQGHAVAGNPVLFHEAPIRSDDRWAAAMTGGQNAVVAAIAWPLMVRYGYRIGSPRPRRSGGAPHASSHVERMC